MTNPSPSAGVEKPDSSLLADLELVCGEIFDRWDKDQRSGKLLLALSGFTLPGYDPRVDRIRAALTKGADHG